MQVGHSPKIDLRPVRREEMLGICREVARDGRARYAPGGWAIHLLDAKRILKTENTQHARAARCFELQKPFIGPTFG